MDESMPEIPEHDVLIAGGGPAGATAAYLLAQQGLDVVVIDKSIFPRKKLCGGLITTKTLRLLERVFGETLETLKQKKIINYITDSYEVRLKNTLFAAGKAEPPFVLVDRSIYDGYLLNKAKESGTTVIEGEFVKQVDPSAHAVVTASGKIFKAKFIVGADGVNSRVRKALPEDLIRLKEWKDNLGAGLEVFIPRSEIERQFDCPVVYFGLVNWGYAWIFPNQEQLAIGVGAIAHRNENLRGSLQSLLTMAGYKKRSGAEILGHPVPYGNFLSHPAKGPLLLAGDAAGFVDPFLGEGIFYAQRSAELAARSIQEALQEGSLTERTYPAYLQADILKELAFIRLGRRLVFGAAPILGYSPLRMIYHILGPQRIIDIVQGIRYYRVYRKGGAIDGQIRL